VRVPEECELLNPGKLYVLGEDSWLEKKLLQRQKELTERRQNAIQMKMQMDAEYEQKSRDLEHGIEKLGGALEEVIHELNNWCK